MPTQKKILIIAESIDIEDSSGTKGRVALIKNLHKAGYKLQVYHYTRKEIQLEGIPCISIKEKRFNFLFFLSRIERYLRYIFKWELYRPLENLFGFSFTLFNDRNSIKKAIENIENFDPDYILTLSKGGSFRPHHALLKLPELHHKWIAYIHDPYPMHLYPRPFAWVEPGHFQKWKFIDELSKKAAFSAFPSVLLKEWMGSYFPEFLKRGIIIPHQISDIQEASSDLPDFFNKNKFNILHAGNLLAPRNPKSLVEAYEFFLETYPEARQDSSLIFIGNNAYYKDWLSQRSNYGANLYVSEAYVPFEQVYTMQEKASVNVILEAKSEISPFLPGKFPHCVKSDSAILLLGPSLSESRRLLGEEYPYWSEIDDTQKIAGIIELMYLEWKKASEQFRLDRKDLEEYLSFPYLSRVIENLN